MSFNIEWVKKKTGKGGGHGASSGVKIYRSDYVETKSGTTRINTVARIGSDVMRSARLVVGDQVQIGVGDYNGERVVAVRRVVSGGHKLSGDKEKTGKSVTAHVKVTSDAIPLGEWHLSKIKMLQDGAIIMRASDGQS